MHSKLDQCSAVDEFTMEEPKGGSQSAICLRTANVDWIVVVEPGEKTITKGTQEELFISSGISVRLTKQYITSSEEIRTIDVGISNCREPTL